VALAVLGDPDAEQPGAGRTAVPPGRRLFADLRPDADRQPHARRAVHARRLYRREHHEGDSESLARRAALGPGGRRFRGSSGKADPEKARRERPEPGARDARHRFHARRLLPDRLGRRPDPGADARIPAGAGAHRRPGVPGVPPGGGGDRRHRRRLALLPDGKNAPRRDDSRRRRRPRHGARGRDSRVAALHHGVLPGRGACRRGRRDRRPDHVRVPGPRCGHAAARADRRDPRRRRQPGRRLRRQLHHRLRLHLRRGAAAGSRLRDPVPADDPGDRLQAAGTVREIRGMKRWILPLVLLAFFPLVGGEYYINLASQIFIFAVFAASINLLLGYGGLPTLGHAAYLGVAAYLSVLCALKLGWGHLAAAPAALVGTTLMAAAFGLIALRATGLGFLMLTLALSQVLWGTALRWVSMTDGDNGLRGLTRPFGLDDAVSFYYFAFV